MNAQQIGEPTGLSEFIADLKSLDGQFGPLECNANGTLISNDEGYLEIAAEVTSRVSKERSGIGFFIGGGGALSMLPGLAVEATVLADKNPFVGEMSEILAESILESDTPEETLEAIDSKYKAGQYAVLRSLRDMYEGAELDEILFPWLRGEARSYGHYHWSAPDRFPLVKEALLATPLITIGADITNPGFSPALGNTLDSHNRAIAFANLTNVHAWVGAASMKFINDLPFHSETTILYTSHKGTLLGDFPKMAYSTSADEYLSDIQ